MHGPLSRFLLTAGIISTVLLTAPARAQDKSETVKFTTIDGVNIIGEFYRGKGAAPVAMLLHAYESNSSTKDWKNLALALQKAGYAVLAFDFRGHGKSTTMDPDVFWKFPANVNGVRTSKRNLPDLDVKTFQSSYRSVLVNDIAAAKAYLDRAKNDARECNSGAVILIGAEDGATLGSIWLNSETYRYKLIFDPAKGGLIPNTHPEAKDVCACLFLSPNPKLGSIPVTLKTALFGAGRKWEVPIVFMHGSGDTKGKELAKSIEKYIRDERVKDKLKFTGAFEIKGGGTLTGAKLLKHGNTIPAITDWLDQVVPLTMKEWEERDFKKTQYRWFLPGKAPIPAKVFATDTNMAFDNYMFYVR